MVQEDEGEEEHPRHHGEGTGVVGVGTLNEPLILQVGEGTHRHLELSKIVMCEWVLVCLEGETSVVFQKSCQTPL